MAITIREFAFEKLSPTDAVANAALNGTVTYVLLSGYADVSILSQLRPLSWENPTRNRK
jgi:hypothetical protein